MVRSWLRVGGPVQGFRMQGPCRILSGVLETKVGESCVIHHESGEPNTPLIQEYTLK